MYPLAVTPHTLPHPLKPLVSFMYFWTSLFYTFYVSGTVLAQADITNTIIQVLTWTIIIISHSPGGWEVHDQSANMVVSWFSRQSTSCFVFTQQREKKKEKRISLFSLLIRALISFMRAPPSWPNYHPDSSPSNTIILGIKLKHMNLRGETFSL